MDDIEKKQNVSGPLLRAIDREADSPIVSFEDRATAVAYVMAQNRTQGRERMILINRDDAVPDRNDGTPSLIPLGRTTSLGGELEMGPAEAIEVAAAIAHAATGVRRIANAVIATPIEDRVSLEIQGSPREWSFTAQAGRILATRLANLGTAALSHRGS